MISQPNYTTIPNNLLGQPFGKNKAPGQMALMSEVELKVYLAILRATLGYHKRDARVSVRSMALLTGLSTSGVQSGASGLEEKGLIKRIQDGGVTKWSLITEWDEDEEGVPNSDTPVSNSDTPVSNFDTPSSKENSKENLYSASPEKTLSGETALAALDREEDAAEGTAFTVEIDTLAQHEGFLKYNAKTKAKARFRCPQCGDNDAIAHSDEKTPCCGATIIWRNNPLWEKHQRQKAADEEAKERHRQKSDDPAVGYLETAADAKVKPNEVRQIQNFVTRNGLPRFMALVDDSKAKATDEGKWGRGIIAIVVKRLSHWGNGKSAEKKSTSEPVEQAVNLPKGTVMAIRPEALAKLKELGIE